MKIPSIKTLLFTLCLTLASAALQAAEGTTVVLPRKGITPAETPAEINVRYEEEQQLADKYYNEARLLFRSRRWQDCIDKCNQALTIHPGHKGSIELKHQATTKRLQIDTTDLDAERRVRDDAALRLVTEEGLMPERGSDLPRPKEEITREETPFAAENRTSAEAKKLLSQRLPEINLIDADLNYVLQLLFKTTGVNIIYNPADIEDKTVTIYAKDLSLEEILKYLARSYGVGYTVDNNTVWVYASDDEDAEKALMIPAIFTLKHGLTKTGPLKTQISGNGGQGNNNAAAAIANAVNGGGGAAGESTSHIEATMAQMEANWPGWPKETKWWLDRKLNRLVVISTPYIIEEVGKIVKMLDRPEIQVVISARFIEVKESMLDQLGFSWALTPNPEILPETDANGNLTSDAWQDNKFRLSQVTSNLAVSGDALATGGVGIINDHQLTFALNALKQNTGSKTLVAPRIIATNNEEASIDLKEPYPFPTDVEVIESSVTNDTNSYSSTTIVPTDWDYSQEVGYGLTVRPSVGADMKTIALRVRPDLTTKTGDVSEEIVTTDANGDQQSISMKKPIFKKSRIEVAATVHDGGTIVIGGLSLDNSSDIKKSTPVLSKLPGVGKLFRSKDNSRERSCLLIFVTARIVTPQNRLYTDDTESAVKNNANDDSFKKSVIPAQALDELLGDPVTSGRNVQ